MKIIFTADLHYPTTNFETLVHFAEQIEEAKPDILVLGGDLAECLRNTDDFSTCLNVFTSRFDPVLVLAGNHDLWQRQSSSLSSLDLWKTVLPKLTTSAGAVWLEDKPFYSGSIAVVGSYLHYDYSAAEKVGHGAGFALEYWEKYKHRVNNDGQFLHGLPSDIEFAKEIGDAFKLRLEEAQLSSEVKEIIVATHVPIVEEQVTRKPHDYGWAMGTPYFGCLSYDHWIDVCSKISHIICGHNHKFKEGDFHRCDLAMSAASVMDREKWSALQNAGITMKGAEMHPCGFNGAPHAICCGSDYGNPEFVTIETGL